MRSTVGAVLTFDRRALGIQYGGVDGALSDDVMTLECRGTLGQATARDPTAEFRLSTIGSDLVRV